MLIEVRSYNNGDEHQINNSFNTIFNQNRSIDEWLWKFKNSPFGKGQISIAFVDGELAAHISGYPIYFDYFSNDTVKSFLSYQIGDKFTLPKFRKIGFGKSSLLSKIFFNLKDKAKDADFGYGFATHHSLRFGVLLLGYETLGEVSCYLGNFKDRRVGLIKKFSYKSYTINEITGITDDFDKFYNKMLQYHRLIIRKNKNYLKWRYIDHPSKRYNIFSVYKRGDLSGWFICQRDETTIFIGDFLTISDNKLWESFINYLIDSKYLQQQNILLWHPDSNHSPNLKDIGFKIIEEPNRMNYGILFRRDIDLGIFKDWRYTKGDGDLF